MNNMGDMNQSMGGMNPMMMNQMMVNQMMNQMGQSGMNQNMLMMMNMNNNNMNNMNDQAQTQMMNMMNQMNQNNQNNQNNDDQSSSNQNQTGGICVIFRASGANQGEKSAPIMVQCLPNDKVSDVIERYRTKSQDRDPSKKFIFNAKNLNLDLTVQQAGFTNNANIFVVTTKGIKGAK